MRIGVHASVLVEMGGHELAKSLCKWTRVVHRLPFVVFELCADEECKSELNFLRLVCPRFVLENGIVSIGGTMACSLLKSNEAVHVQETLLDALSTLCLLHTKGVQLHPDMHCALPYRDYTYAEAVDDHARSIYNRACLRFHAK